VRFNKVLIANRGEIALRVIEACRELALSSVAIYSEADRGAHYLELADEAICIGPASPNKSYLNVPALISAAELTGAEAIHPGYGFLAESPHFVEVCEEHGLVFVGPDRNVMRQVGNKLDTREAVAAMGIPILPGALVPEDPEGLLSAGEQVGYPLFVKAVFGGGGRGMRLVRTPLELQKKVRECGTEARAAFGDPRLYLERALDNPRHIEVQIIADSHGRVIHLGERECSIQRRHQKLIEEAPAPHLDPEKRAQLHTAAIRVAQAIGYQNVGTVEFILDAAGDFYFVEMNARIQVEHPVSEVITGVNLVKEQLRLAAGANLNDRQGPNLTGHAIECRINAEDPARGFLPASGRLHIEELPSGNGIRLDTAIYDGMEITPHYDSLLAKVITWGEDRDEARIKMYTALDQFRTRGIATTRSLVQEVISRPEFRDGQMGTGFLDHVQNSWGQAYT
jgi:acetyl-CoA carboxylase biotin carboxylase subunit